MAHNALIVSGRSELLDEQPLPMPNDDYIQHSRRQNKALNTKYNLLHMAGRFPLFSPIHQYIQQVVQINENIKEIEERMDDITQQNKDAKRIMSMTGFGSFGALLIALEIDGIKRFTTSKKLMSWIGMRPTVHQSGNMMHYGKMKKDSNRRVNRMMIQTANVVEFKDDRMKEIYDKARKKHPHGIAISHVANKMATIIGHT